MSVVRLYFAPFSRIIILISFVDRVRDRMQNEYVKLIVIGSERFAVDFTFRNRTLLLHLIVFLQSYGRVRINTERCDAMPLKHCKMHKMQNQRML